MKNTQTRILLILSAFIPLSAVLGQSTNLDLYINPDIYSKKIASTKLDDPRLGTPSPVLDDAKAALGWQFADFTGTVEGYVPDAKIGKDMFPVNNTIIRAQPGEGSAALGVYTFGNPMEIIDTGLWWKIQVEATFPVYFVMDTLPPVPLAPSISDSNMATADIEPSAGMIDDTTLFDTSVVVADGGVPPVSIIERTPEPRKGVVAQYYTGILHRSKHRIGLFKAKAPYYLEGANGKRLLWVDFGEIIMPGSINEFLGRDVIINGEPTQDEKSKQWILHVRTIRNTR